MNSEPVYWTPVVTDTPMANVLLMMCRLVLGEVGSAVRLSARDPPAGPNQLVVSVMLSFGNLYGLISMPRSSQLKNLEPLTVTWYESLIVGPQPMWFDPMHPAEALQTVVFQWSWTVMLSSRIPCGRLPAVSAWMM